MTDRHIIFEHDGIIHHGFEMDGYILGARLQPSDSGLHIEMSDDIFDLDEIDIISVHGQCTKH